MNRDIRQFKLINGEEIICEVVEEYYDDELDNGDGFNMYIKAVMALDLKVYESDPTEEPFRYYSLNPWMVYGENTDTVISLRAGYIVAEAPPSVMLLDQYIVGVKQMHEGYMLKLKAREDFKNDLETVKKQISKLEKKQTTREKDIKEKEADNVINLFKEDKKDTIH